MTTRGGFTLIEVVASLAVAAFVLLVARTLFDSAMTASRFVAGVEGEANDQAQRERTLFDLAAQARFDDSTGFFGQPTSATFATWCEAAGGWREPCTVTLLAQPDSVASVDMRNTALAGRRVLMDGAASYSLIFLRTAANGGEWAGSWSTSKHAPVAIGVVTPGDTLLLPLGVQR